MYADDTTVYCIGKTIDEVSIPKRAVRLVREEQANTTPKKIRMHANL